jgi:hypothetical protein
MTPVIVRVDGPVVGHGYPGNAYHGVTVAFGPHGYEEREAALVVTRRGVMLAASQLCMVGAAGFHDDGRDVYLFHELPAGQSAAE